MSRWTLQSRWCNLLFSQLKQLKYPLQTTDSVCREYKINWLIFQVNFKFLKTNDIPCVVGFLSPSQSPRQDPEDNQAIHVVRLDCFLVALDELLFKSTNCTELFERREKQFYLSFNDGIYFILLGSRYETTYRSTYRTTWCGGPIREWSYKQDPYHNANLLPKLKWCEGLRGSISELARWLGGPNKWTIVYD